MKLPTQLQRLLIITLAAGAFATVNQLNAQDRGDRGGRGNFDPAQMRQRMMERIREEFDVKSDDEWKIIETRLSKVMEAQREARMGMGFGGFRGPRRGGGDGGDNVRRNNPFGEPSPEAEALQKAVELKASSEELKTKLAKFRESRKAKEAALEKAQDDLRKVLSARQEAAAVLAGLLK